MYIIFNFFFYESVDLGLCLGKTNKTRVSEVNTLIVEHLDVVFIIYGESVRNLIQQKYY